MDKFKDKCKSGLENVRVIKEIELKVSNKSRIKNIIELFEKNKKSKEDANNGEEMIKYHIIIYNE